MLSLKETHTLLLHLAWGGEYRNTLEVVFGLWTHAGVWASIYEFCRNTKHSVPNTNNFYF
jgi:hypothetical protein